MGSGKTVFLIDISSFIFRAFFAIRKLSTTKGLPVNAVYGVVTMLLNLLEKHKPDSVICVFDTPKPSFRKEIYPEYKSNRGAPPDELIPQFEWIEKAVKVLGIKRVAEPGYEADDLIATLTKKFKDTKVVVVTGDKDLMQLVNDRVTILDTMKDVHYGVKEVKEKMGVMPSQITDYLGLIGDSSDNIPGVEGIGPKTAVELLELHSTLEGVLEAAASMKEGKRKETLLKSKKIALLSKELATVKSDLMDHVKDVDLDQCKTPTKFGNDFRNFLDEMEFKGLVKKYFPENGTSQDNIIQEKQAGPRTQVSSISQLRTHLKSLQPSVDMGVDIEVEGRGATKLNFSTVYLSSGEQHAMVSGIPSGQLARELMDYFKTCTGTIYFYDLKKFIKTGMANSVQADDFSQLLKSGRTFDIMIAHYLVHPEEKHDLESLEMKYLGQGEQGGLFGGGDGSNVTIPSNTVLRIGKDLKVELESNQLNRLFSEIEMPVVFSLAEIENAGVHVDKNVLAKLSKEFSAELAMIEKQIYQSTGHEFNLNSPKQLGHVLFDVLKLPVISKTKTGYSTDAEVLNKLSSKHEVPAMILRYRELTKLKSTYVDVIPTLVEDDGRVHALFNQAVAATGRLSSSDPNLQNIPIKTDSGIRIRSAFIPEDGNVLVGADYSQIELRIVAHLSDDPVLIKAFNEGKDVHRATAAEIFHVSESEVTDSQRSAAKAINFGLIYGKTAFGLSQELNISRTEAQNYIDAYFRKYTGVKAFMDKAISDAREKGYALTLFGRKRPIKDIDNKNMAVRNFAERMAMNTPVQGTAADIIKIAMIRAGEAAKEYGGKLILQVHDELVLEVPKEKAEQAKQGLKSVMESTCKLKVPLTVQANIAKNWMEL